MEDEEQQSDIVSVLCLVSQNTCTSNLDLQLDEVVEVKKLVVTHFQLQQQTILRVLSIQSEILQYLKLDSCTQLENLYLPERLFRLSLLNCPKLKVGNLPQQLKILEIVSTNLLDFDILPECLETFVLKDVMFRNQKCFSVNRKICNLIFKRCDMLSFNGSGLDMAVKIADSNIVFDNYFLSCIRFLETDSLKPFPVQELLNIELLTLNAEVCITLLGKTLLPELKRLRLNFPVSKLEELNSILKIHSKNLQQLQIQTLKGVDVGLLICLQQVGCALIPQDLEQISSTKLKFLEITSFKRQENLNLVGKFIDLTELAVNVSQMNSIDFIPIFKLQSLQTLKIQGLRAQVITNFGSSSVKNLTLSHCEVEPSKLNVFTNLHQITINECQGPGTFNLSSLAKFCCNLQKISVMKSGMVTISAEQQLITLSNLYLDYVSFGPDSMDNLPHFCPNIQILAVLSSPSLKCLDFLPKLQKLTDLQLDGCKLLVSLEPIAQCLQLQSFSVTKKISLKEMEYFAKCKQLKNLKIPAFDWSPNFYNFGQFFSTLEEIAPFYKKGQLVVTMKSDFDLMQSTLLESLRCSSSMQQYKPFNKNVQVSNDKSQKVAHLTCFEQQFPFGEPPIPGLEVNREFKSPKPIQPKVQTLTNSQQLAQSRMTRKERLLAKYRTDQKPTLQKKVEVVAKLEKKEEISLQVPDKYAVNTLIDQVGLTANRDYQPKEEAGKLSLQDLEICDDQKQIEVDSKEENKINQVNEDEVANKIETQQPQFLSQILQSSENQKPVMELRSEFTNDVQNMKTLKTPVEGVVLTHFQLNSPLILSNTVKNVKLLKLTGETINLSDGVFDTLWLEDLDISVNMSGAYVGNLIVINCQNANFEVFDLVAERCYLEGEVRGDIQEVCGGCEQAALDQVFNFLQ